MSAIGSIIAAVEERVTELLDTFAKRDDAQDKAIKELQDRVSALESGPKTTAAKTAAAPKATTARATTAGSKGSASGTGK